MSADNPPPPAGGQTLRIPGATRDAALHDQLYRYAQDMQELLDSNNELEQRYRTLRESYESVTEGRSVLEGLIHASRDMYLMTDRAGTVLRCNPAAGAIAPAPQLLGAYIGDLLAPADLERIKLLLDQLEDGGEAPAEGLELRMKAHAGATHTLIASLCPMPVRVDGDLRSIHWMIRDMTHMREAEFESKISSLVFGSTSEGVMITDCEGGILAVNPAFSKITGYSSEEAVGKNPRFLQSGAQDRHFYEKMWHTLRTDGHWQGQISNRKKDGEIYIEWLTLTSAQDDEGKVLSYIGVFSDLSRLMQAEKRLFDLAHSDALTQLPNSELLQDRLQQMIGLAKRRGEAFAVMAVDLDRFKQINDAFGHVAGDQALNEIAARLTASMRAADTVARIGGNAFAILAPGMVSEHGIGLVAGRIIGALLQPLDIDGREHIVGASIGVALYPDHGEEAASLLGHAQIAMREAKRAGGNTHAIYRAAQEAAGDAAPADGAARA